MMPWRVSLLVAACLLVFGVLWARGVPLRQDDSMCQELRRVHGELQKQTQVAIRLPVKYCKAFYWDVSQPLYVTINHAESDGYEVTVGYVPNCNGGAACRHASFEADPVTKGLRRPQAEASQVISLPNGLAGYVVDSKGCATGCNTSITWQEGKIYYTVGIKYGALPAVRQLASDTILSSLNEEPQRQPTTQKQPEEEKRFKIRWPFWRKD